MSSNLPTEKSDLPPGLWFTVNIAFDKREMARSGSLYDFPHIRSKEKVVRQQLCNKKCVAS